MEGLRDMAMHGMTAAANSGMPKNNPSFLGEIDNANERANMALVRVMQLADRLCGSMGEDPSNEMSAVPSGLFGEAEQRARRIAGMCDSIVDTVSRIERSLP